MDELDRRGGHVEHVELAGKSFHHGAIPVELTRQDRFAKRRARELEPARAHVEHRRDRGDLNFLPGELLDVAEEPVLAWLGECDRDTLTACTAGSPDAVHVGRRGRWHVEVDDVRELLDVEPAGRDVGGDQQIDRAAARPLHDAVPLLLRHAAVQRLRAIAARRERLGEHIDLGARAAEDDREAGGLEIEHPPERRHLLRPRHDVRRLPHSRDGALRRLLPRDLHANRPPEVPLRDRRNAGRHRRGEERGLPLGRRRLEDLLDLLGKPHVEHLVAFVEHDGREVGEIERAPAEVIERASRRRDDDMRAAPQCPDLLVERLPPVDGNDPRRPRPPVLVERLGHLHRELTRRDQDEHEGPARSRFFRREPLDEREGKGGRLSGSRRGLAEEVPAGEERWDGLALDGSRLFVAEPGEGLDQVGAEPELGEGRSHARSIFGA